MLTIHDAHDPGRSGPAPAARAARTRALLCFAAFAAGTLAVLAAPAEAGVWFSSAGLFGAACVAAGAGLALRGLPASVCMAAALGALGAANATLRVHERPSDSIAADLETRPAHTATLIEIEGIVLRSPERRPAARGALADHVPAFIRAPDRLRIDVAVALVRTESGAVPASGVAGVSYAPPGPDLRAGQRVRARGFARPVRAPTNPGAYDFRPAARERGDRFWLDTGDGSTLRVIEHPSLESSARGALAAALAWPRRHAHAIISRATEDNDAGELVRGLILGVREHDADGLGNAFQRIGLAHLLSVSGFHVAVMALAALLFIRATGDRGPLEPLIAAAAIALYMLIVPVRAPILRAGFTVLVLLVFDAIGRRHDRLALLAWIAIAVAALRPTDLLSIGYQLSFGLVAWLILISEPRPDRITHRTHEDRATLPLWRLPIGWLRAAALATAACWSLSIPLVLYHTGAVAPLAVIATILAVPLIVLTMWIGFVVLLLGSAAPALGDALAAVLAWPAGLCAAIVRFIDASPLATIRLPSVSLAWTALATLAIGYAWRRGSRTNAAMWALLGAAAIWLAIEARSGTALPSDVELRATMLDVGNGSAVIVERGRDALLWDAGSFRETIGVRTIPDAARAIGAPRIRTAVITHANLDHFMGLLDIARPLGINTVVTGESFDRAAQRDPDGPAAFVLRELAERGIAHRTVAAGDTVPVGDAELRILYPPAGFVPRTENDASLVAAVRPVPGGPRLLLTGDIQDEAIATLLESRADLSADILELPHHGSARPAALEFVRRAGPSVVLQSTGPDRLDDPRWDPARPGRAWLVTARDGAVRAEIRSGGGVSAGPIR